MAICLLQGPLGSIEKEVSDIKAEVTYSYGSWGLLGGQLQALINIVVRIGGKKYDFSPFGFAILIARFHYILPRLHQFIN